MLHVGLALTDITVSKKNTLNLMSVGERQMDRQKFELLSQCASMQG